jgi:small subunit ribosomal protein S13
VARISGIDLPREKRVDVALTYVYGIGPAMAGRILKESGVKPTTRAKDLTESEVHAMQTLINKGLSDGTQIRVEGDLRREIAQNIKRLVDIGSYRGSRHRKGLPVRGQRTKTNSRTRKGPRRTVAGKKMETK